MTLNRIVDDWGRVQFHGTDAVELLMRGYELGDLLFQSDAEVEQYNTNCRLHNKEAHYLHTPQPPSLTAADDRQQRQAAWSIPEHYRDLDLHTLLLARCQSAEAVSRVQTELTQFEAVGMIPVLRLMCFLVDHWRERKVVWGVGRGSSVASYCLFLLGVHRIDSLAYELDCSEFIKHS